MFFFLFRQESWLCAIFFIFFIFLLTTCDFMGVAYDVL